MKTTKRVLSLLLSLLLALLLLVPAAAEEAAVDVIEDAAVDAAADAAAADDSYAPIIVKQPRATTAVKVGKTLKLSVEAQLPAAGGELSYAWYDSEDSETPIATGAELSLPVTKDMLGQDLFPQKDFSPEVEEVLNQAELILPGNRYFYVVVTNTYTDDDGIEQSVSVASDDSRCYVYQGLFSLLGDYSALIFSAGGVFGLLGIPFFAVVYTLILHPMIWLTAMGMNRG